MINSLTIRNFKSHRDIAMCDLGRINLILGKNNAGKTAILEALFLAQMQGSPKAAFEYLNHLRGIQPNSMVWDSVFHGFHAEAPAEIETVTDGKREVLRILAMRGRQVMQTSQGSLSGNPIGSRTDGLLFQFVGLDEKKSEVAVTAISQKGKGRPLEVWSQPVRYISSRSLFDAESAAIGFGKLVNLNRRDGVVAALHVIDPRLARVESIATETGPELLADIGEDRLMPLSWMGDGMLRILDISTSVALSPGGLVLVDEFENGLHYSVMCELWKSVFEVAIAQDVQVFAATHNDEMIGAVVDALRTQDALSQLRAWRCDLVTGGTRITDYTGEAVARTREFNQEIR